MQNPFARISNPAMREGLLFGIVAGILEVIFSFINLVHNQESPSGMGVQGAKPPAGGSGASPEILLLLCTRLPWNTYSSRTVSCVRFDCRYTSFPADGKDEHRRSRRSMGRTL